MIALRKKHDALRVGAYTVLWAEENLFAFRRDEGSDHVTAVFNTGDEPQTMDLTGSEEPVHIPPHSVKIIEKHEEETPCVSSQKSLP